MLWPVFARLSFLLLLFQCVAGAQGTKASFSPEPLAPEIMFRLLYREVANFQAHADDLARQSKPDSFVREYHRNVLQLNATQNTVLKQIFIDCTHQLLALDEQAAAIINAVKSKYRNAPHNLPNSMVPSPPQELLDLEAKRNALVLAEVQSLSSTFGVSSFAVFQSHVRQHIGSHYRSISASQTK